MSEIQSDAAHISWDPKNVFSGTAWYYARYRPDYPDKIFHLIRDKFKLNKKSRVLDLGCGTGQIALKLAPSVEEIIAIDPQEEMLKEGRRLAGRRKIRNITWIPGESKDLKAMSRSFGKIDLTVIAGAFHWMDRAQTLADLYPMTVTGGGIALVGGTIPMFRAEVPWIKIIDDTVIDWLGKERKAGTKGVFHNPLKWHEDYLRESRFTDIRTVYMHTRRKWTINRIIGFLYSTSASSIPVLGDKKEPFENELRKRLTRYNPSGIFYQAAVTEIITARKHA